MSSPPAPAPDARARSHAEVNAAIRALLARAGGGLSAEDREEYLRLRAEWVQAA